ncbi:uncharacterized protein LOC111623324 [Centruroides sculpturatus]|uniref:uncharacterized protein LOC111623324 n=1 Tax=Centruroides sculpturatus TaxID=218467 RepID=UPI000C6D1793|nr:uncharacterized protein LOC111623324 [Centruroides sculpturatus]
MSSIHFILTICFILGHFYIYTCDTDCVEDYFECLMKNVTMEECVATEKQCCEASLNETDDMWTEAFNHCLLKEYLPLAINCLNTEEEGGECSQVLEEYFNKTDSNYNEFWKSVLSAVQRPTTAEECADSFFTQLHDSRMKQCEQNKDEVLDDLCSLYTKHSSE